MTPQELSLLLQLLNDSVSILSKKGKNLEQAVEFLRLWNDATEQNSIPKANVLTKLSEKLKELPNKPLTSIIDEAKPHLFDPFEFAEALRSARGSADAKQFTSVINKLTVPLAKKVLESLGVEPSGKKVKELRTDLMNYLTSQHEQSKSEFSETPTPATHFNELNVQKIMSEYTRLRDQEGLSIENVRFSFEPITKMPFADLKEAAHRLELDFGDQKNIGELMLTILERVKKAQWEDL